MNPSDALGYLASALVLATFCMRGMVTLRALGIASNLAFIAYGVLAGIHPVLLLHLILLPVNICRLIELLKRRGGPATPPLPPRQGESP